MKKYLLKFYTFIHDNQLIVKITMVSIRATKIKPSSFISSYIKNYYRQFFQERETNINSNQ